MVDILESKVVGTNKETWYKLVGTSEDTKPIGEFPAGTGHTVANGSRFYEVDTETGYEFKEEGWIAVGQNVRLPDVTTEDNGKVLSVVDGAWDKAEVGGGDNVLVFSIKNTTGNYNAGFDLVDCTAGDIADAILDGKIPVLKEISLSSMPSPVLMLYFSGTYDTGDVYRTFEATVNSKVGSSQPSGWLTKHVSATIKVKSSDGKATTPTATHISGSVVPITTT